MRVRRSEPERRTCDGILFDSIAEMQHYGELKLRARAGEIEQLRVHPKFDLRVNDAHICWFCLDFSYVETATKQIHLVDVKGWKVSKKTGKRLPRVNREFGLKRKLLKATFGLDVELA